MLDEKNNNKKGLLRWRINIPKTKENAHAEYAIAVAAQGERNQMQDLKRVGSTRMYVRSTKVRKLEDIIYVAIVMLVVNKR